MVLEQNMPGATFGFGVVFSDGALEFLRAGEPEIFKLLEVQMERWPEQKIVHRDEAVLVDGNGFSAIARLKLLTTLERLCESAGVRIEHGRPIGALEELSGFDLVVGADGVNSAVRRALAARLQPRIRYLTNKFAWYGTTKAFDCLTITFRQNEHGHFVAHHYRYAPDMSTFIVECDAATWYRAGLDRMSDEESRIYCERVFAPDLDGCPLMSNRSIWRNFPLLWTPQWTADNVVLIGDAVRTGHFSIGSGTRLAMEDSIALAAALDAHGENIAEGLAEFEHTRKPIAEKIVTAANASSYWYERISEKMALAPWQLAYDYMTRSGRMPDERLRTEAPRFMARVDRERAANPRAAHPARQVDPCGANSPGAREIGWTVPERYNSACILFDNLAAGRADKAAVVCEDRTFTYAQIVNLACRVGNGLATMGLARGSRVLLVMLDTPEYAAAIFGAMRAGFVPVLVNTLSPAELVAYYLGDSGAEAAIVNDSLAHLLDHPDTRASRLRNLVVVGGGAVPPLELVEITRWDAWTQGARAELDEVETHPDEMAFWMYSSGSTGRPKGVVHLHHDAPYTYESYGRRVLGIRESDVVFSPPKIFFAYGFGNALTFPFSVGATAVLHPGRPDPDAVYGVIERHRPTILCGLPTLYNALIVHPGAERRDLSSLRLCISAAETLSQEMFAEWEQRYGLRIVEGLGSTEVLHIYVSNRLDRQRPGASGARVPGYEIKLCDPDGSPVPHGEPGIMWVRGDSSAPFYWNRPDKTRETMREGWIYTGDRFREDADGYYWFEGRADDLVKVSGQWVHPMEVERALAEHPSVRECAVLAVEDENRLMTLKAYVALRPGHVEDTATTKALQEFVKRALMPFKYPRAIEYLDELPKTGTDKIDRQRLRLMGKV
ncbi:MAG TPA: benzoate-CoA ligase family protein [Burkholderiales bacterium]|jgi:benzoate-CoA ligase family protein|nr:benzoate-CoA ligase family protein [Burkholderiales bacterium]